ncbi:NAD(P)H-hydrate dehydratase [Leptolyngbya sp. PL-A3]
MRAIESRVFAAGMPVPALMEKAAGLVAQRIIALYPATSTTFGVLVGPGHNGGDALVVARELHVQGYSIQIYCPFERLKELTDAHARYARSLTIPFASSLEALATCDVLIDGLFGFGLERSLTDPIATAIATLNTWQKPLLSIDLPSGIHTDTGEVLGIAIRATHTFCLGLWKRAFMQDAALEYIGTVERVDFGLPVADVQAVVGEPEVERMTNEGAIALLPLPRPADTHKYKQGNLLLIAGSRTYPGAAILTALAARASGVGMLTMAVPQSLAPLLVAQVPDALVVGLPETDGAIAHLPADLDLSRYSTIACGPGLTPHPTAVIEALLASDRPLVLDADGLNILAARQGWEVRSRSAPTILTPHLGEFRRLFPQAEGVDRIALAQAAARSSGAIVLLKGARVAIAHPESGKVWVNPESTPALARGGSGDVLTGLLSGLLAQATLMKMPPEGAVQAATWWHSQAARWAAQRRTELGVDAVTLAHSLIPALQWNLSP